MFSNEKLKIILDIMIEQQEIQNSFLSKEEIEISKCMVEDLKDQAKYNIDYVIGKIKNELPVGNYYATIWWYSVLLQIKNDVTLFKELVEYIINRKEITFNTKYFLYYQLEHLISIYYTEEHEQISNILVKLFEELLENIISDFNVKFENDSNNKKSSSLVVIVTGQFLDEKHSITRSMLKLCEKLLKKEQKEVIIINTADLLTSVGEIPFLGTVYGKNLKELQNSTYIEWNDIKIPYVQCEYPMPSLSQMKIVFDEIENLNPEKIIVFGKENLLGAILNKRFLVDYIDVNICDTEYDDKNAILEERKASFGLYEEHSIYEVYSKSVRSKYKKNFELIGGNRYCSFDDCILDFFPLSEDKYLIYNKIEQKSQGILNISDLKDPVKLKEIEEHEFYSIVLEFDGDWNKYLYILKEAAERKVYIICKDIEIAASYLKLKEIKEYIDNIKIFKTRQEFQQYFHVNKSEYLPKLIFGENEHKKKLSEIINEEHLYRLTKEGRDSSNVILTIGIPTHDRGNLLLERLDNLIKMPFDSEIEFIVSKNGSLLYQDEYKKASMIQDARLLYYGTDEEIIGRYNWANVVKYAHGRYVLIVSDEDDVINDALEHYMNILQNNSQLSQMRVGTSIQYSTGERYYGEKGRDAFLKGFLRQNYLSGLIVDRIKFIEANVMQYEAYIENPFYRSYPHEWWCAALSMMGDCLREPVKLIEEKESVIDAQLDAYERKGKMKKKELVDESCGLPLYASYESRLKQFIGQMECISVFLKDDLYGMQLAILNTIDKLAVLFNLARSYGYKKEKYSDFLLEFVNVTQNQVDKYEFKDYQKRELYEKIRQSYEMLIQLDADWQQREYLNNMQNNEQQ